MKKLASLSLAVLLLFALAAQVSADVIWEPMDDYFQSHRDEFSYVECRYEAQKDTPAFRIPGEVISDDVVIPAGTVVFVNWQNEEWAATWVQDIPGGPSGDCWIRLADFRRLYWKSDFQDDHRAEIRNENGEVPVTEKAYLWAYPGSGTSYEISDFSEAIGYYQVYTDEEGRDWGRVSYYYGHKDEWVCISDPGNPDLPAAAPKYAGEDAPAGTQKPSLGLSAPKDPSSGAASPADVPAQAESTRGSSAADPPSGSAGQENNKLLLPVIGLVVLVVAVTAALLFVLRKRAGKEKK